MENYKDTTEELEMLKERLNDVIEELDSIADSNKPKKEEKLLKEYGYIKSLIESKEKELQSIVQLEQKQEMIQLAEDELELEDMESEEDEFVQDMINNKDEMIDLIDEKTANESEDLDEELGELEYQKETILQSLYMIESELLLEKEKLQKLESSGKKIDIINSRSKIRKMERKQLRNDRKLSILNDIITVVKEEENDINKEALKQIEEVIIDYNTNAIQYGLDKISLVDAVRERDIDYKMHLIKLEQQRKYRLEIHKDAEGNTIIEDLDDNKRKQLEEESAKRMETPFYKKSMDSIKRGISGIKDTAYKIIGEPMQVIGKNAKKLWSKIKLGLNKALSSANSGMLTAAKSVAQKAEQNEITFEQKREVFTKQYESTLDGDQKENFKEKTKQAQREKLEEENELDDSGNVI